MHPSRHKAGDMGHVCQQVRTHFIRNGTERREINRARVGRIPTNNQFGLVLESQLANGLHVETLRLFVNAVLDTLNHLPLTFTGEPWVRCPP